MINKFLFLIWYLLRPKYYRHFFYLIKKKFLKNHDTKENRRKSYEWCKHNAVTYFDVFKKIGVEGNLEGMNQQLISQGFELQKKIPIKMGRPGHVNLIYDLVRLAKPKIVIETGVAYGWSSLAILKAISDNDEGKLISIDMPYPTKNNDEYVGAVIPLSLRHNWRLIRKPDKPGITDAINLVGGKIDFCHYDSDKSWWGRKYAYSILWNSLRSKGIFISDDIQDNLYFYEFVKNNSLEFAVTEFDEKFIGIIRKP